MTVVVIVIIVVVVALILFSCDQKQSLSFFDKVKKTFGLRQAGVAGSASDTPVTPKKVTFAPTIRSANMLQVEHNDPLLLTLFSKEVQLLPDGVSQEQFDALVEDYHDKNLKVKDVVIPRSVNFNFEKYTAEQELMNQNVKNHYQQFTSREVVGGISDCIARGVAPPVPGRLQPRVFNKKVAKR